MRLYAGRRCGLDRWRTAGESRRSILDLSGRSRDGKYWRWVGAPIAEAIEYATSSRETAGYFDGIIATMCLPTAALKATGQAKAPAPPLLGFGGL